MKKIPQIAESTDEDYRPAILVLEGNPETKKVLARIFHEEGYSVHESATAGDGIEWAGRHAPDIILIGGHLPGMEGPEIVTKLKANSGCTSLIAVLGFRAAGADACVPEAAGPDVVKLILGSLLRARKAESARSRFREEAETLSQALRQSQDDLEKFTLRAAHDFEETLRAVTTFAQLIADGRNQELSESEQAYQKHVLAGTEKMRRLLQYMLSYSRIGREDSSHSSINLSAAVVGARHNLGKAIKAADARVNVEGRLPLVRGNLSRLQEMLESLMRNALQYRRAEGAPVITVAAARHNEQEWLVSVADNGIGIPGEYLESVFEPFKRLHGRELPGSGMGLTLSRKIVEVHGGRIWLDSKPGEGTTVFFTLPLVEEMEAGA